ncbi:MAG: ATP-binding protein, partial [Methylacidiphilales bacterium]|nr:ATP-binding protein [Candidatus Methylacidiphilales bacterium]
MSIAAGGVKGQVPLKNVANFMTLVVRLQDRDPHLPGFGVCHGPSGYGKTYASIYAQNKTRAVRVEVGDTWTRKTLLKALLFELGEPPRGTVADINAAGGV